MPTLPHLPATAPHPSRIHFEGELRDNNSEHIADIRPTVLMWYAARADDIVVLNATVSFEALTILNHARRPNNQDVNLRLYLTATAQGKGIETQTVDVMHRIPASDWLRFLAQARHATYALVELPLDGAPVPQGLASALERYRDAIQHLQQCQWDSAIAECREALDRMETAIGATEIAPAWADYASGQQRTSWTFAQRIVAIRTLIRHGTHTAHHGQNDFSADEARYIVDLTGVALKFYSNRLRV